MKYVVELEYTLTRRILVHAANPKLAEKHAIGVVSKWEGVQRPSILSVTEAKGETP